MQIALSVCLIVVGLINLGPVLAAVSAAAIESAYAITLPGADFEILMRHRALMFGVLGGFVLFSVFKPRYQWAAMTMAGASMLGFAALVISVGNNNPQIDKVLTADMLGIAFLVIAIILKGLQKPST